MATVDQCLLCKNARCQKACPINTPIPEVIKMVREGKRIEAEELLFKNNPFSAVCAYVCDHVKQCRGNCVLNAKNDPVRFHDLEKEISSEFLFNHQFEKTIGLNKRVAVIGGGPAGMTVAIQLAEVGVDVTIFEANSRIGGVLRYGIPDVRLPKKIVDQMEKIIVDLGIKIRPNTLIGPTISIDRLLEDKYDAVFISTGVWKPKSVNIPGETFGHVHYAIDYLKSPDDYYLNGKVVVIGAGNVAMDAARTVKTKGHDVTIAYRKTFNEMSASVEEIEEAVNDEVKFELNLAPLRIEEDHVVFNKTTIDENGQFILLEEEVKLEAQTVIVAVSQEPRSNIVDHTSNLDTNRYGYLITDEAGNTTKKGVFACGDVVTGAKTVVHAIAQAKVVTQSIMDYLKADCEL